MVTEREMMDGGNKAIQTETNVDKYASLTRLITRDLNNSKRSPTFSRYSKGDISNFLSNPYRYEKELRSAVIYMYGASPHFKRLIQYFVGLTDLSYVVEPYKVDIKKSNLKTLSNNYRKTLALLSAMEIKSQFPKILTVCLREDVFFGTIRATADSVIIQQLPSDYCAIEAIENNVLNVSFNFSYFSSREEMLDYYSDEFKMKYEMYKKDRKRKWIELDSPTSFAIKCNSDILDYAIPPFASILREIYDIEDYKRLKLTRTEIENYAMISMRIPTGDDGEYLINYDEAKKFWRNLENVLPDEIGSVLTPMDIDKTDFNNANNKDVDNIAAAEQNLFTAAGVSSLLFNNEKASANALMLSIKADQTITYGIVKSIETALNRYLHSLSYAKNYKISFLDVSPYNRKEMGDAYLKAASYGLPTISMYASTVGLGQAELDGMSMLETQLLGLQDMFLPLMNSAQMSSGDVNSDPDKSEGGRPEMEVGERTDSGEQSSEDKDDWG